jgi:hypothetical protein
LFYSTILLSNSNIKKYERGIQMSGIPFIDYGSDEMKAREKAGRNSQRKGGFNTERILRPNQSEPLRVVPLANMYTKSPNDRNVVMRVKCNVLWFDGDAVDKVNAEINVRNDALPEDAVKERPIPKTFTIVQVNDVDPMVDIGLWLKENAEKAFANMTYPGSTNFGADSKMPLQKRNLHYLPVLHLNDATLKPGEPPKVKVLEFSQATIRKSLEAIESPDAAGSIKGRVLVINKNDEKSYSVVMVDKYDGEIPDVDVNPVDFIPFNTHDETVKALSELYNIPVPLVSELPPDKQEIINKIDAYITQLKFAASDDESEDEWSEA